MDALRASTMLLLVPVHAAGLLAVNGHPGTWATAIFWLVHVFRLPLFFAMSGFFLALLLDRKGPRPTVRNRTVRIVVPLAVGTVTLVPLMIVAADLAGVAIVPAAVADAPRPFELEPSFLWFLWYLLIVDGAAFGIYLLAPRLVRSLGRHLRSVAARPLLCLPLLAVLSALPLWREPTWFSAPSTTTFVPDPLLLIYNALFFAFGAMLYANRDLVEAANRGCWRWAAGAIAATVPAGVLFALHNSAAHGDEAAVHAAALLTLATATWCSLIALVGLADRYLNRSRPALRYLADSSYWIYLSHLPAMVLVVGLTGATALGTGPQFLLVTAASLAFSLLTYPLFVRHTAIGRLLNGPRPRPRRSWRDRLRPALGTSG
jgi:glucan biosynthesis protein C